MVSDAASKTIMYGKATSDHSKFRTPGWASARAFIMTLRITTVTITIRTIIRRIVVDRHGNDDDTKNNNTSNFDN